MFNLRCCLASLTFVGFTLVLGVMLTGSSTIYPATTVFSSLSIVAPVATTLKTNCSINVFWHIYCTNSERCNGVLERQFNLLTDFGLLNASEKLLVGIVGTETPPALARILAHPKTVVLNRTTKGNEDVTSCKLKEFANNCTAGNCHIAYIHSRGVTHDPNTLIGRASHDWTLMMEHFVIRRWQEAVKKLDAGFRAAGCEMWAHQHRILANETIYHFSGNFWWARSDYVQLLPSPLTFGLDRYMVCEDWILQLAGKVFPVEQFAVLHRTARHKYQRGMIDSYVDRYPATHYSSGSETPIPPLDPRLVHGLV